MKFIYTTNSHLGSILICENSPNIELGICYTRTVHWFLMVLQILFFVQLLLDNLLIMLSAAAMTSSAFPERKVLPKPQDYTEQLQKIYQIYSWLR